MPGATLTYGSSFGDVTRGAAAAAVRCGCDRLVQRRRPAAEVERPFLPLAHLAAPHLAELVVAGQELRVAEAARVVAHLLLAELVDVDLEQTPLVHRRELLDAGEELVVLVLQLADVFFELVQLVVLFDHGCRPLQYAPERKSRPVSGDSALRSIPSVERLPGDRALHPRPTLRRRCRPSHRQLLRPAIGAYVVDADYVGRESRSGDAGIDAAYVSANLLADVRKNGSDCSVFATTTCGVANGCVKLTVVFFRLLFDGPTRPVLLPPTAASCACSNDGCSVKRRAWRSNPT